MNHLVLLKNAVANVFRGSAAALVAILLPPFLTRTMVPTTYGAWMLILQLSAYVGYLDFGIQTAVGRFVAYANELTDVEQRNRIVSTALVILTSTAILGMMLIGGLAWQLPNLFRHMPADLYIDARWTLLIVGSSLAIGLPFSVFNGIFVGLQRYEIPAIIISSSKLASAVLIVVVAKFTDSIIYMGIMLASVNLLSYLTQYTASRRFAKDVKISTSLVSRETGKELFNYCFSLSIWSFAMLLVSGLDTTLVGFFDFNTVAYYSIAATLITFIAGIQVALFNGLMPMSAVMGARKDSKGLGKLLVISTKYGVFILLLVGLPLIFFAPNILVIWIGKDYATRTTLLLQILVIANVIRLSAVPYATLLIGTGQQRLIILSPLLEGFTNLFVSISAGIIWGAIGVAIGTLVGSIVAIICNIIYSMPRSTEIAVSRAVYIKEGLLRPLVSAIPLGLGFLILGNFFIFPRLVVYTLLLLSFGLGAVTLWKYGMTSEERQMVRPYAVQAYKSIILTFHR